MRKAGRSAKQTDTAGEGPHAAQVYWDGILDAQNLEREAAGTSMELETEIGFAQTPDFICAAEWLEAGAMRPGFIIDLGAGLGANAFALARRGHRVVAIDTSPARLRALRVRAQAAGVADRVRVLVAAAERLPFATETVPALYTKSVLIHTDLPRAAAVLARVLMPGGRAALVEPQPGNPFVNLYRRTLAPKAWQGITTYFGPAQQRIFAEAVEGRFQPIRQVAYHYVISFFAFGFQFAVAAPRLFRAGLAVLLPLDKILLRFVPKLRQWAWFGVIRLEKPDAGGDPS